MLSFPTPTSAAAASPSRSKWWPLRAIERPEQDTQTEERPSCALAQRLVHWDPMVRRAALVEVLTHCADGNAYATELLQQIRRDLGLS